MRLYTLTGATRVDDPQYGSFEAGPNGEFDFPNELSERLHAFHVDGQPTWEDDAERVERLRAKQLEEMRDPATLLAAVQALASHQADLAAAMKTVSQTPADPPKQPAKQEPAGEEGAEKQPAKRASRRSSTAK